MKVDCFIIVTFFSAIHSLIVGVHLKKSSPRLMVISFDGFRADYLQRYPHLLGNLSSIAKHVKASHVIPTFPTYTLPTHYSIVTGELEVSIFLLVKFNLFIIPGVYPETHGIVHNSFIDPDNQRHFEISNMFESHWWNSVEPLWVTAARNNLPVGIDSWPGSDVIFSDKWQPRFLFGGVTNEDNFALPLSFRLNRLLDLMVSREISLAMLYHNEPDATAHVYGPVSHRIEKVLIDIDNEIGILLNRMKKLNLENEIDLMIISDHGLSLTGPEQVVAINEMLKGSKLEDFFPKDENQSKFYLRKGTDPMTYGAVIHLWPTTRNQTALYEQLKRKADQNIEVYRKEDIPAEWHYKNNNRIAPIILVAKAGWRVVLDRDIFERATSRGFRLGLHGYSNDHPDMFATFIAQGPSFMSNITLPPFESIVIYNIIMHCLGLPATQANATIDIAAPSLALLQSLDNADNCNTQVHTYTQETLMTVSPWQARSAFIIIVILFAIVIAILAILALKRTSERRYIEVSVREREQLPQNV